MIYGTLQQWPQDRLWLPESFSKALAFLKQNNAAAMAAGRYDIDGAAIFALVQDAQTDFAERRRFELHQNYADIQLLLTGREMQLYAPAPGICGAELTEDRLKADDIAFYTSPAVHQTVLLEPGSYAVYLPEELHCPCCTAAGDAPGIIRKVVFKLRLPAGPASSK